MSAPAFTPGPWWVSSTQYRTDGALRQNVYGHDGTPVAISNGTNESCPVAGNARLIATAPDHALICWAMCVQDAHWEEWVPFDGKGEFCFAGLKYATSLDEFGCPRLTDALRAAITQSQTVPA